MIFPSLLVVNNLVKFSDQAQGTLAQIEKKIPRTPDESIELKGLFVFMVAALETMLPDTYKYYLQSFPHQFEFKEAKFDREDFLDATLAADLLEAQIDKRVVNDAYGPFPKMLAIFRKALRIDEPSTIFDDLTDFVVEIKETRNVLLHNNLIANGLYVSKAGKHRRAERVGVKLPLTQAYVATACSQVGALIKELRTRMEDRYKENTRIAAFKRIWVFFFDPNHPLLKFEDYWVIDYDEDRLHAMKNSPIENKLASSEKMFIEVWRTHFSASRTPEKNLFMYGLDGRNRRKMLWFLSIMNDDLDFR
jgi:tetratricopeptide (TPR) repeat protein